MLLDFYSYSLSTAALAIVLLSVSVLDTLSNRIPNVFTLGGTFAGLSVQAFYFGFDGLLTGIGGFAVGLAMFLPFYILKGMSAGDVKLMGMVGTFLGPKDVLLASGLSLVAGFFLALVYIAMRGELLATARRFWLVACNCAVNGTLKGSYLPPSASEAANRRFPYAAAIAAGTGLALWQLGYGFVALQSLGF